MKTEKPLTLYHGSTAGWLHHSGFRQAKFPYGEFTHPHPFVFLCTNQCGGKNAAYKSYRQVGNRNPKGLPTGSYDYEGTSYKFNPYLYEVEVPLGTEYIDFKAEKLTSAEREMVFRAMSEKSSYKISKLIKIISAQINYLGCPKYWAEILQREFGERNALVAALANSGFYLIKNFEPDGDGQCYGEVWCAPMKYVSHLKIKAPSMI